VLLNSDQAPLGILVQATFENNAKMVEMEFFLRMISAAAKDEFES